MNKLNNSPLLISILLLQSCTSTFIQHKTQEDHQGYFVDASNCFKTSMRKEQIKVPTGLGMTQVEIATTYDAGAFANCMRFAGHTTPTAHLENYLTVSRQCYLEARGVSNSDDVYGDCVQRSRIGVELLDNDD